MSVDYILIYNADDTQVHRQSGLSPAELEIGQWVVGHDTTH